jgi:ATP-dependent RNA helicase DDX1
LTGLFPPVLQAFKEGDVRFLICTDVAARGIDIKELPYVINLTRE